MTQSEFNKTSLIDGWIEQSIQKDLTYRFVVDEFQRSKWNINLIQAEYIADKLGINRMLILFYALELNILNVDAKTKKMITKALKNKHEYYDNKNDIDND